MEDTTMKKTYINPTLDVVEMKYTHQLLNGSGVLTGGVPDDFDWDK